MATVAWRSTPDQAKNQFMRNRSGSQLVDGRLASRAASPKYLRASKSCAGTCREPLQRRVARRHGPLHPCRRCRARLGRLRRRPDPPLLAVDGAQVREVAGTLMRIAPSSAAALTTSRARSEPDREESFGSTVSHQDTHRSRSSRGASQRLGARSGSLEPPTHQGRNGSAPAGSGRTRRRGSSC